jgi:hypothetical protein
MLVCGMFELDTIQDNIKCQHRLQFGTQRSILQYRQHQLDQLPLKALQLRPIVPNEEGRWIIIENSATRPILMKSVTENPSVNPRPSSA